MIGYFKRLLWSGYDSYHEMIEAKFNGPDTFTGQLEHSFRRKV